MQANKTHLLYPNNSTLSILLMQEKADHNSKWVNYFKMLPTNLTSFPIFYT